MCLGIPGKIITKNDNLGVIDFGGISKEISLLLLPEANRGDYVLVHAGFALQIISEEEAFNSLKILKELALIQEDEKLAEE